MQHHKGIMGAVRPWCSPIGSILYACTCIAGALLSNESTRGAGVPGWRSVGNEFGLYSYEGRNTLDVGQTHTSHYHLSD